MDPTDSVMRLKALRILPNESCYLSLVLPLYNEERCLKRNFQTIVAHLDTLQKGYEIILVNDGSTDGTASIIRDIVDVNPQTKSVSSSMNNGKGHAVRTGVLNATGKYIVHTDADLAVPVGFIGSCLRILETGIPVVVASRHLLESNMKVREGPLRQFLGESFRRFAKLTLGLKVSDITCGLKGCERNAALEIFSRLKINRWGYDAELVFVAQRLGYRIGEIPVDWYHSFDSKVKVVSASVKTLLETFQIRYYHVTKRYSVASKEEGGL